MPKSPSKRGRKARAGRHTIKRYAGPRKAKRGPKKARISRVVRLAAKVVAVRLKGRERVAKARATIKAQRIEIAALKKVSKAAKRYSFGVAKLHNRFVAKVTASAKAGIRAKARK